MPRYKYECDRCGDNFHKTVKIEDRHNVMCRCGGRAVKLLAIGAGIEIFEPMMYNDICETPIWVESKKQLKEECKKHNVLSCRLM